MLNNDKWIFVPRAQTMHEEELEDWYRRQIVDRDTEGFNWYVAGGISLILLAFVGGCFALKPLISWGLHSMAGWLHSLFQ